MRADLSTRSNLLAMQHASHKRLLRVPGPFHGWSQRPPVDAIVVPAHRSALHLEDAARLAASTGSLLLVLASHRCRVDDAAVVASGVAGCRALVVDVPADYHNELLEFDTSASRFAELSAGRRNDLSLKRNLGLLIARLSGWRKILFLDDDMRKVSTDDVCRVAAQLEISTVAGMVAEDFPDNSVVCHAKRLAGMPQGNFVTGGALGQHTADLPLEFYPAVYNEDWFCLAQRAAAEGVCMVGTARQDSYNPFDTPRRAEYQEFGDVLAEGLFAATETGKGIPTPSSVYWNNFIEARSSLIEGLIETFERLDADESVRWSLLAAQRRLSIIRPGDCVDFVDAWKTDRASFARRSMRLSPTYDPRGAVEELGLETSEKITI